MAFKLDIDNAADGRPAEGAYWSLVSDSKTFLDKSGALTFYGYASKEARDAGKLPVPGAVKQYTFTPEQFAEAQATPLEVLFPRGIKPGLTAGEINRRLAYHVARSRKDVACADGEGKPVLRSFFENAQDV